MFIGYAQIFLFILLGAVLNEAGIHLTAPFFWLILFIILGILLTFDMMGYEDPDDKHEDEEEEN